jgi:hypothetical protein
MTLICSPGFGTTLPEMEPMTRMVFSNSTMQNVLPSFDEHSTMIPGSFTSRQESSPKQ